MARHLAPLAGMFKIGSQLFTLAGPVGVEKIAALGPGIFLDLKFHDIPNTVAGAVAAAARLRGVELINVHALGGAAMMRAAAQSLAGRRRRPRLIAVTVLTSLDDSAMKRVGIGGPVGRRAVALARLAMGAGLDGVVASAHEVRTLRRACRPKFLIVVPGVRPATARGAEASDDQSRIATPEEAIRAGADYIVVGRPITAARDPAEAAAAIVEEIARASR